MEWGALSRAFPADVGKVVITTVTNSPFGAVLIEDSVFIESVKEGLGVEAAGDVISAVTAIIVPKAANLVNKAMGAVYIAHSCNPNLFPDVMEALTSNAVVCGGYRKAILVVQRDTKGAFPVDKKKYVEVVAEVTWRCHQLPLMPPVPAQSLGRTLPSNSNSGMPTSVLFLHKYSPSKA